MCQRDRRVEQQFDKTGKPHPVTQVRGYIVDFVVVLSQGNLYMADVVEHMHQWTTHIGSSKEKGSFRTDADDLYLEDAQNRLAEIFPSSFALSRRRIIIKLLNMLRRKDQLGVPNPCLEAPRLWCRPEAIAAAVCNLRCGSNSYRGTPPGPA